MHRKSAFADVLLAVMIVATALALIATLIALGPFLPATQGDVSATGNTPFSLVIILYGAVQSVLLFGAFIYVGLRDRRNPPGISRLYPPMLTIKGGIMGNVVLSATQAFDLLAHDLKQGWAILYEPEVRIVQSLFLLVMFGAIAWLLNVILSGRGVNRRALLALNIGAFTLTALLVAATVLIAGAVQR